MAQAGQKLLHCPPKPNETSPLRSDFYMRVSPQGSKETSSNHIETGNFGPLPEHESISYAARPARTRSQWYKATRGLVVVIGMTLIVVAIVLLVASISTSTGSRDKVDLGDLKSSRELGVLEIPQGKLKWNVLKSRQGRDYYAFYKVPYAKPPIGDLRFESPQPAEKWDGIRFEKEVAPQCLQRSKYSSIIEAVGDENCLFANIYTPKLPGIDLSPDAQLLPTLFYIHGGQFKSGNGSRYGGKYFMDEDVVLITLQYRLGLLGFLSSEDGIIKGNMGMKDQVQALKWVKENIKYFGGDPDLVMIFGNSAGAMSVNQLMVSPMAAGLFHRAISQGGESFNAIVKSMDAQFKSYEALLQEVGCWSKIDSVKYHNRSVLQCLREQNASDIAVVRGPEIIFALTVENYEADEELMKDKFLHDTTLNLYMDGKVNKVPWLIGVNSAEWITTASSTLTDLEMVDYLNQNWTGYAPSLFDASYEESKIKDTISTKSKEFYFGGKKVGNDTLTNLTNILSDRDIIHGSKTQGVLMSEFGVDVFFYYMSKRPLKSYFNEKLQGFPPGDYGAAHADELQYLFDYSGFPEYLEGSEYFEFSKDLVRIWVQFAATGNPGWDPIKKGQTPTLWYELNDRKGPTTVLQKRMEFWDQFSFPDLCYT